MKRSPFDNFSVLRNAFIEVSGLDVDDNDGPALVAIDSIAGIVADADDEDRTIIERDDGCDNGYVDSSFEDYTAKLAEQLRSRPSLSGTFIRATGFDDNAEGNFEETPVLIPAGTILTIRPHPQDDEKTFIQRMEGYTDCYIDRSYADIAREIKSGPSGPSQN